MTAAGCCMLVKSENAINVDLPQYVGAMAPAHCAVAAPAARAASMPRVAA